MSLDHQSHLHKIEKRVNQFSSHLMSNSKWLKLFRSLSDHKESIAKCYIVDIWDDIPRLLDMPDLDSFDHSFHEEGVKDIVIGGPYLFREIRWIEFPALWEIKRQMRDEELAPMVYSQDIDKIHRLLIPIGELDIEHTDEYLRVYGYK